jgi:hypothetical protein
MKNSISCILICNFIISMASGQTTPDSYPRPGIATKTPVLSSHLDKASYVMWTAGEEEIPSQDPSWVLWTADSRKLGHSGVKFGSQKIPGVRHLRIGFTEAICVGSILVSGNVRVSVLKSNAPYPGTLSDDDQWVPAERFSPGGTSFEQMKTGECAIWILPPETKTRALRFTHDAVETDASYEGFLSGVLVLKERFVNLAPFSIPVAKSNNKQVGRIINGRSDGWGAWDSMRMDSALRDSRPAVSQEHPEWVMLVWSKPVELNALLAVWCGFGSKDIQVYTGSEDRHPRDAPDTDWKTLLSPSGFESGYPSTFWPNYFPFANPVSTRAIRLRITSTTPGSHPHIRNKPLGGLRIWLGEIMALRNIGSADLKSIERPEKEVLAVSHPPIPIRFTLPEDGYVTLVIEKDDGVRVRNLVSETFFPAGENIAWWDGTDDLGRDADAAWHGLYNIPARFVEPGIYKARGLWRKEIEAFYEFAVYSHGNPPWNLPDHTGGWLANHSPPSAALFVPASHSPTHEPAVFLGAFITEGPDGLAWIDLNGRKRGGMKWIGGNWTAAPFLCRDVSLAADTNTSAYVASVWETKKSSAIDELRITALVRSGKSQLQTKMIYKGILDYDDKEKKSGNAALGGIAAYDGTIVCSFPKQNRLTVVDASTGQIVKNKTIEDPRGLAFDAAGRLYVLSGTAILRFTNSMIFSDSIPNVFVRKGLEDPVGLTLDSKGNIYVSDCGSSHQVKVFNSNGRLLRKIGLPGRPAAGPYEPLHMNNPAGIAIDSADQIWVTENDYLPKRVSVWSLDGRLLKAFYGPGKYGGGGMLDAHDSSRFYYADEGKGTLEFALDWEAGTAQLKTVLYRRTSESLKMPFRAAAPEMALYRDGQRYFANCYNSSPTGGHSTGMLFIERDSVAHPVAAMGMANDWSLLKTDPFLHLWPEEVDPKKDKNRNRGKHQALFIWVDTNEDGKVQPSEVVIQRATVGGVTIMDDLSFCIARVGGKAMRFKPVRFSKTGVPFYTYGSGEVLAEGVHSPKSSGGNQILTDDSDEMVATLGVAPFDPCSISGVKNGRAVWSYPSPWPGLHAAHHAARPTFPGQIIGTTRLLGGFVNPRGSEVGPLWAVNGNMGNFYIFTRDGLFVATVFEDSRQGSLWRMSVARRGMSLKGVSLHEENFWPSISQTQEGDIYVVDGSRCSLVRLDGLDTLRRIEPIPIRVTATHLSEATQHVREREALRQQARGSGVLIATISKESPVVDGDLSDWLSADWVEIDKRGAGANFNSSAKPYNIMGAMVAANDRLYLAWDTSEPKLLQNSGEIPEAHFKTGGALDIMLATGADLDSSRNVPVEGDLRLLIARVKGKTHATLYRPVVTGTAESDRVPFSSPWRTINFDSVEDISEHIEFAEDGKGAFEVSVPLSVLGLTLKPGMRMTGDIGVLRGNGSETTARIYWSNKATGITADVPSEAELTPALWGTIEWR